MSLCGCPAVKHEQDVNGRGQAPAGHRLATVSSWFMPHREHLSIAMGPWPSTSMVVTSKAWSPDEEAIHRPTAMPWYDIACYDMAISLLNRFAFPPDDGWLPGPLRAGRPRAQPLTRGRRTSYGPSSTAWKAMAGSGSTGWCGVQNPKASLPVPATWEELEHLCGTLAEMASALPDGQRGY